MTKLVEFQIGFEPKLFDKMPTDVIVSFTEGHVRRWAEDVKKAREEAGIA